MSGVQQNRTTQHGLCAMRKPIPTPKVLTKKLPRTIGASVIFLQIQFPLLPVVTTARIRHTSRIRYSFFYVTVAGTSFFFSIFYTVRNGSVSPFFYNPTVSSFFPRSFRLIAIRVLFYSFSHSFSLSFTY